MKSFLNSFHRDLFDNRLGEYPGYPFRTFFGALAGVLMFLTLRVNGVPLPDWTGVWVWGWIAIMLTAAFAGEVLSLLSFAAAVHIHWLIQSIKHSLNKKRHDTNNQYQQNQAES